jgi:maleate isomerase
MTDQLGWRKKFGVIIPSTNTIVEPDFYRMTVPGVTPHISRIHIRDQNLSLREFAATDPRGDPIRGGTCDDR